VPRRLAAVVLAAGVGACLLDEVEVDREAGRDITDASFAQDDADAALESESETHTDTDTDTDPRDGCLAYCEAYDDHCGLASAHADLEACVDACSAWGLAGTSCRAAFLGDALTSCVAAGPASPVCARRCGPGQERDCGDPAARWRVDER